MSKERLTTFIDAVIAIIMTILVLDLPHPELMTWDVFWHYELIFSLMPFPFSG